MLRCSVRVLDLDERPKFSALSHVWGVDPPALEHAILCGGVAVPFTSNCHSALWRLRQKLGKYTIWVDAVCINQADQAENNGRYHLWATFSARLIRCMLGLGLQLLAEKEPYDTWLIPSSRHISTNRDHLRQPGTYGRKIFVTIHRVQQAIPGQLTR